MRARRPVHSAPDLAWVRNKERFCSDANRRPASTVRQQSKGCYSQLRCFFASHWPDTGKADCFLPVRRAPGGVPVASLNREHVYFAKRAGSKSDEDHLGLSISDGRKQSGIEPVPLYIKAVIFKIRNGISAFCGQQSAMAKGQGFGCHD
jgi:hypothetical protein